MTRTQLFETARELPLPDRIDLALDLWDTIDFREARWPLTESQKAELDRRRAADEADPQSAEEWTVLREKILQGDL